MKTQKREEYRQKIESQFKELGARLDQFRATVEQMSADTQDKYSDLVAGLEARQEQLASQIETLKNSSAETWEDIKTDVDNAANDFSRALIEAVAEFEESSQER